MYINSIQLNSTGHETTKADVTQKGWKAQSLQISLLSTIAIQTPFKGVYNSITTYNQQFAGLVHSSGYYIKFLDG